MDKGSLLSGMAIGAALVFVFDATLRDVLSRARGIAAAAVGRLRSDEVDDERLRQRVRLKIGRACSHPRAIHVYVNDGEVTLIGPALADEVRALLTAAASVRGVHSVVNDLEPHDAPGGVLSLQGDGRPAGPSVGQRQRSWPPATRAIVGVAAVAAGGLAVAYARR